MPPAGSPKDISVVACADSFAFRCISALLDSPAACGLCISCALAVCGARTSMALAAAINNRSFMSRLLESAAAVLVLQTIGP
jgi:uncharacterized membrane protein YadS